MYENITKHIIPPRIYNMGVFVKRMNTDIQQLCEETGCSPEDLPEAMNDWEKWRERVRDIRASGMMMMMMMMIKEFWEFSRIFKDRTFITPLFLTLIYLIFFSFCRKQTYQSLKVISCVLWNLKVDKYLKNQHLSNQCLNVQFKYCRIYLFTQILVAFPLLYIYIYIYKHTYIYVYTHTYIPTHSHTYINTYTNQCKTNKWHFF